MTAEDNKKLNALIVEDETMVGMGLRSYLEKLGHKVVGQAASSGEAIAMYRKHKPSLVLLDIHLDGADGIDLASRLMAERPCPMIIVSAYSEPQLIGRAAAAGVFGYLIKPATREGLAAQIGIVQQRFGDWEKLQEEKNHLSQTLDARKYVDKAKGILMKHQNMDEPAAHRWLQLESQKRRISLGDMAKSVIAERSEG